MENEPTVDCGCHTVEVKVLVTADSHEVARERARAIAASLHEESDEFWITAHATWAVDRSSCRIGDCRRPRLQRPPHCPPPGEVPAFDAGWLSHELGCARGSVIIVDGPLLDYTWAELGWDAREQAVATS